MPMLSESEWRVRREREATVASIIAAETHGKLWAAEPAGHLKGRLPWFARYSTDEPWRTGIAATRLRDHLISEIVSLGALSVEPYRQWPQVYRLAAVQGRAALFPRLLRIWEDWTPPQDLPSP